MYALISSSKEWITFAADICILLITIYTFYITFISQKIKLISISQSSSNTKGDSFYVVLENKSLSPQVITNINLIIENKYKVNLNKFEIPFILEPYKAKEVGSDRYSYTMPSLPYLNSENTILEVTTTRNKLYLSMNKKTPRVKKEMKEIPYNVTKIKNTYNERIIPKDAKFVLNVSKGDWQNIVFVFKTGLMTGEVLGCNGLPEEVLESQENFIQFLDIWLKPNGLNYHVEELTNLFDK